MTDASTATGAPATVNVAACGARSSTGPVISERACTDLRKNRADQVWGLAAPGRRMSDGSGTSLRVVSEGGTNALNWVLPRVSEEGARALAAELSLHPLAARVLIARGFTSASEAAAFLS